MELLGLRRGNYTLTRVLGEGGMGVVYLAEHAFLERRKAVKVLRPEAAENPSLVRRFFDEATAASHCAHDHIVAIEDCGTFQIAGRQYHYIDMELLEGVSLAEELRPPRAPTGRMLDLSRIVRIAATTADALAAAHARGIVHRDVKTENVFLARRGHRSDFVKVLDFGIARLTGDLSPGARTRTGAILGTPAFMSPEQAQGLHPDGKSDVFSLGVVLYRMLAGELPFRGDNFTVLAMHIVHDPPPPLLGRRPDAPAALIAVVEAALRKAPGDRPTMLELRDALLDAEAAPRHVLRESSFSLPERVAFARQERAGYDATQAGPGAEGPADAGHDAPSANRPDRLPK